VRINSIGGDLIIEGRDGSEFKASGDTTPDVHMVGDGNLEVVCSGDCKLRLPNSARITINSVGGDMIIKEISADLAIGTIGAEAVIRDCGSVSIERVGSDLEIKRANGQVRIQTVGGDVKMRGIAGAVNVMKVGGEALLIDLRGDCHIERIGGDITMENIDFKSGTHYSFNAGGSMLCKVAADANVRFKLPREVGMSIEVPNARLERQGSQPTIVLGEGAAFVDITALGGDIRLVSQHDDIDDHFGVFESIIDNVVPENLEELINNSISERMSAINERVNRETERLQREAERMQREAERAGQRAREQAERMAEKMRREAERNAERVNRAAEHGKQKRGKGWDFSFSWPNKPEKGEKIKVKQEAAPPTEPVSDDERMMILRMVEAKQISIEEAERLLSALEG
jgi:hypothetical protein